MVRKFESLASESATLHAYLREIASFPPLSPDDERELGNQIQQTGDEEAVGRLVQANLRFVAGYARRFRRVGVPLLDLIHEGNLGLIEAARRFGPGESGGFQNQALWWIRQAVMHVIADCPRSRPSTVSGLMAAAAEGRHADALCVSIECAKHPGLASGDGDDAPPQDGPGRLGKTRRETRGLRSLRQHAVLCSYLN